MAKRSTRRMRGGMPEWLEKLFSPFTGEKKEEVLPTSSGVPVGNATAVTVPSAPGVTGMQGPTGRNTSVTVTPGATGATAPRLTGNTSGVPSAFGGARRRRRSASRKNRTTKRKANRKNRSANRKSRRCMYRKK